MGITSSMIRPKAIAGTWGPTNDNWYFPGGSFYGGADGGGIQIGPDSAMRQMTVYSCVKILSQSISQLPCHLIENDGDYKNKATTHSLYQILHDQPNSWQTSSEFWGMVVAHLSLRGDFVAFKQGIPGRPVLGLLPIPPDRIRNIKQNDDYSLTYTILTAESIEKDYRQDKIFHVRGLTLDGIRGVNPITHARESVGLALSAERFLSTWFSKGMHPGAIIEHPQRLDVKAHANLRKEFQEKYTGLGRMNEFMLIDEGMKIQFPPINLVDAQFIELNKLTISQIAGIFRVPLLLLQAGDNPTTYASAEQFMLTFVTHALTPIIVNIEKAIYRDLLSSEEKKRFYAKFSMAGLLRGDMASRYAAYQTGINTCFLSPNEARMLEEMNPYSGGDEMRTRTSTVKQDPETDPPSSVEKTENGSKNKNK